MSESVKGAIVSPPPPVPLPVDPDGTPRSLVLPFLYLYSLSSPTYFTLKIEAARVSEMLVCHLNTARCRNHETSHLVNAVLVSSEFCKME